MRNGSFRYTENGTEFVFTDIVVSNTYIEKWLTDHNLQVTEERVYLIEQMLRLPDAVNVIYHYLTELKEDDIRHVRDLVNKNEN